MGKKVKAVVKIQIQGGKANPAPPVGTALGPHGINLMQFCKEYNAKTAGQVGQIVPVEITIFHDSSFSFILKTPPSAVPNRDMVGTVTEDQLREIAEVKMKDLNARDLDQAMKIIAGTARSMGITVAS